MEFHGERIMTLEIGSDQIEFLKQNLPTVRVLMGAKTYKAKLENTEDGRARVVVTDTFSVMYSWKSVARAYFGNKELRV